MTKAFDVAWWAFMGLWLLSRLAGYERVATTANYVAFSILLVQGGLWLRARWKAA